MSKKTSNVGPREVGGWAIYDWRIRDAQGRLLTLIEALGLPEKQEEALKGLIKQELWKVTEDYGYLTYEQVDNVINENKATAQSNIAPIAN